VLRFEGWTGAKLDGVLSVVCARVRVGGRAEGVGIVDVVRVGQDLRGTCCGLVRWQSSCGLGRVGEKTGGHGTMGAQFGKGEYVDFDVGSDGGDERFGRRGTLRVSVLRRFRELSGLLNAERLEDAKLRLQGERLFA